MKLKLDRCPGEPMPIRNELLAGVAAVCLAGAAPALAQETYFSLGGGLNVLGDADASADCCGNYPLDFYDRTFSSDEGFVGSIAIGHEIHDRFRLEGELSFRSNSLGGVTVQNEGPQAFDDGKTTTFSFMANGWFDFDTGTHLTPYIGGGVGGALVSFDASTLSDGPCSHCYSLDFDGEEFVFAWQLGAGVAIGNPGELQWTIDYRFFHANGIDLPFSGDFSGTAETTGFGSHSAMVGLRMPLNGMAQ